MVIVLMLATLALLWGWQTFWFLCDDAYIAFRYVSNSLLGYGYTWNAPPFRPVEGYTSFLWVLLLDVVWRTFGVDPPRSANTISLLFSFGSVGAIALLVLRTRLPKELANRRVWILALVLTGTLTNRTFLAWTSSGLETAMFTFFVLAWCAVGLTARPTSKSLIGLSTLASLVALCRPDGLLFVCATALLCLIRVLPASSPDRRSLASLAPFAPFVVPLAHLLWRRWTYGFWLPNTWYAKAVSPWPESGVRYFASFALEYAWWWTLVIAVVAGTVFVARAVQGARPEIDLTLWMRLCVVSTLATQFAYYTFRVGGDHFEYRVYNHLVPLFLLAMPWLWGHLSARVVRWAPAVLAVQLLLGLPVPWLHWSLTRNLDTREETHVMRVPVEPHMPIVLRSYGRLFDELQDWLIVHHVGMRHQEHKVFGITQQERFPSRKAGLRLDPAKLPVLISHSVGVPGWIFARANIIDAFGLNDAVVARTPIPESRERKMAHDREPPPGYLECFRANVGWDRRRIWANDREVPLTADDVRACEGRDWHPQR